MSGEEGGDRLKIDVRSTHSPRKEPRMAIAVWEKGEWMDGGRRKPKDKYQAGGGSEGGADIRMLWIGVRHNSGKHQGVREERGKKKLPDGRAGMKS